MKIVSTVQHLESNPRINPTINVTGTLALIIPYITEMGIFITGLLINNRHPAINTRITESMTVAITVSKGNKLINFFFRFEVEPS